MIECGSLEYAQARMQARHGQRADGRDADLGHRKAGTQR